MKIMWKIRTILLKFEKRGLIKRYPKPYFPFLLSILYIQMLLISYLFYLKYPNKVYDSLNIFLGLLTIFSLIFALIHLNIVNILNQEQDNEKKIINKNKRKN